MTNTNTWYNTFQPPNMTYSKHMTHSEHLIWQFLGTWHYTFWTPYMAHSDHGMTHPGHLTRHIPDTWHDTSGHLTWHILDTWYVKFWTPEITHSTQMIRHILNTKCDTCWTSDVTFSEHLRKLRNFVGNTFSSSCEVLTGKQDQKWRKSSDNAMYCCLHSDCNCGDIWSKKIWENQKRFKWEYKALQNIPIKLECNNMINKIKSNTRKKLENGKSDEQHCKWNQNNSQVCRILPIKVP